MIIAEGFYHLRKLGEVVIILSINLPSRSPHIGQSVLSELFYRDLTDLSSLPQIDS